MEFDQWGHHGSAFWQLRSSVGWKSQFGSVGGGSIQDSLLLVRTITEEIDSDVALISLDRSKAFDEVDNSFLVSVLSAAGFGLSFRC